MSLLSEELGLTSPVLPAFAGLSGFVHPSGAVCQAPHASPAAASSLAVGPRDHAPVTPGVRARVPPPGPVLVGAGGQPPAGSPVLGTRPCLCPDDGLLGVRLGGGHGSLADPRPMVHPGQDATHQCPGAEDSLASPQGLPSLSGGQGSAGVHGQHHGYALPEQSGGHPLQIALHISNLYLGVGKAELYSSACCSHPGRGECDSRQAEPQTFCGSRLGAPSRGSGLDLRASGSPTGRPVRFPVEQEVPQLRIMDGEREGLLGRRLPHPVGSPVRVCLSSPPDAAESDPQIPQIARVSPPPDRPILAEQDLVLGPTGPVELGPCPPAEQGRPPEQAGGAGSPPLPSIALLGSLEPEDLSLAQHGLSDENMRVIRAARRDSTRSQYRSKWLRFCYWALEREVNPLTCSIDPVLSFVSSLAEGGIKTQSCRTYLAAIGAYRSTDSASFSLQNEVIKRHFDGLNNLYPSVRAPAPNWDLNVVLSSLAHRPFEPMASCDIHLLTWKTVFLVAITSARRISELQALCADEPYLVFHRDKVVLRTHPSFVPKINTGFHLNEEIFLPTFFPDPKSEAERTLHHLDVRRALRFYLRRTKDFRTSNRLFITYGGAGRGRQAAKASIARWMVSCIAESYKTRGLPVPGGLHAHAVRAKAASVAYQRHVPLEVICRAATWATPHAFCVHYSLATSSRADARFGQAVLQNLFG